MSDEIYKPCGHPVMDCVLGVCLTKYEDRIEELEKERDDYAFKLNEANNTYTEMHLALEAVKDRAKELEAQLAKAVNITERLRYAWYTRDLMQSDFDRAIAELQGDKT